MPDIDVAEANKLLNQKYNLDLVGEAPKDWASKRTPLAIQSAINPITVNWEYVANERLQILMQVRDEANAWHEAFLKERERCERLEKIVFEGVNFQLNENANKTQPVEETKHTIQTQQRMRRPNWPSVRHELEKQFAGSNEPNLGE